MAILHHFIFFCSVVKTLCSVFSVVCSNFTPFKLRDFDSLHPSWLQSELLLYPYSNNSRRRKHITKTRAGFLDGSRATSCLKSTISPTKFGDYNLCCLHFWRNKVLCKKLMPNRFLLFFGNQRYQVCNFYFENVQALTIFNRSKNNSGNFYFFWKAGKLCGTWHGS